MSDEEGPKPAGAPDKPGWKLKLEEKLGWLGDLRLVCYRGHGTEQSLHLKGRLIERQGDSKAAEQGGALENILTTLRRMESDEIPGASLVAEFAGEEYEFFTDQEGFFQINLYRQDPLQTGWHEVNCRVLDSVKQDPVTERSVARVLVPPSSSPFFVVSDIDDTIIRSQATNKLRQAKITLENDAASRVAFEGIVELYNELIKGPDGHQDIPIFYLSNSGWNLYDLFFEFFQDKGLPPGPMYLKDLALKESKSRSLGSSHHKLNIMRQLVQQYPGMPFVLIGDTGQGDAEDYRQIALENPGRIKAVFLREAAGEAASERHRAIAADLKSRGVPMALCEQSTDMAAHMHEEGLISRAALDRLSG